VDSSPTPMDHVGGRELLASIGFEPDLIKQVGHLLLELCQGEGLQEDSSVSIAARVVSDALCLARMTMCAGADSARRDCFAAHLVTEAGKDRAKELFLT